MIKLWQPLICQTGNFGMILFWCAHFIRESFDVFEHDYLEAWNRVNQISDDQSMFIHLFSRNRRQEMYIKDPQAGEQLGNVWSDCKLLRMMRVHWGLFKGRTGFVGLLSPHSLAYVAVVKVQNISIQHADLVDISQPCKNGRNA